jgi:bifunctional oligoribonuclease and PAP phosphatase NrnA
MQSNKLIGLADFIPKFREYIDKYDSFILLGHKSPDGDSLGSMIALGEYLLHQRSKTVYLPYPIKFPVKYTFLENYRKEFAELKSVEGCAIIVVDCSSINRLELDSNYKFDKIDMLIDHHESFSQYAENIWQDAEYPAVGIMIYELLEALGAKITKPIAEALYTAILTDTGQFSFIGKNSNCLRVAANLVDFGAEPDRIARLIYWNYPISYMKNKHAALENLSFYLDNQLSIISFARSNLDNLETLFEMEGLIDIGIMVDSVQVAVLLREVEQRDIRVSFRSRNGFDVSAIAHKFGGGGRVNAAGCNIHDTLDNVKELIIKEIDKSLL